MHFTHGMISGFVLLVVLGVGPVVDGLAAQAPTAPPADFVIRAGDVLKIRVWPDAELSGEFPVEETGYIHLPVLGEVRAGGVALGVLRAELRRRYGEALRSPVVSVTPVFGVSVVGAVMRPGLYPVDPTQTIFDVISLAGGFRDNARTERVRLVRDGAVMELDARQTLEHGGEDLTLALRSGDRVVVPQRRQWHVRDALLTLQSIGLLITLIGRL